MFDKLDDLEKKYEQLNAEMATPAVQADNAKFRNHSKTVAEMQPLVDKYREYKDVASQIAATEEMLKDPDMRELAEEEMAGLVSRREALVAEIKVLLVPKDPNDAKNIILEIRGGTGGDEAALFAADLFRMYNRYAERNGWKVELLSMSESGVGGIKEVIAIIAGKNVYSRLKYESGVHRVQRVPATEASGRIHTSTATVAVLPEAEEVDIHIEAKDLRIDTFCSSGPGGQSVNTTYSAVRITHLPTNTVVSQQDEKSQVKNRAKAMKVLRSRLYEMELQKQQDAIAKDRRSQVGTGERSEKIRTYNFKENRVTDHRIGFTMHQLDAALDGDMNELIDAATSHFTAEKLKDATGEKTPPESVAQAIARARDALLRGGIPHDEAHGDAEVLARHVLGWDLARLAVSMREIPPASFQDHYGAAIARRLQREPVSQIVGHREFWGLDFEVTRDVLTPRPETEFAVQAVLDLGYGSVVMDIGTGSGCIAIALATELPDMRFVASDASLAAIRVARRNAVRHHVGNRIAFLHSELLPPQDDVDIIVSNPPYIPASQEDTLAPEVRLFEPHEALFGGADGLDFYRRLLSEQVRSAIPSHGGHLVVEVGYDQAGVVAALADPRRWTLERTYRDLQGIERTLVFARR